MLLLRSKKYARYIAYSSDVGEAVRPVVSNKVVAAASRSAGRVQHRKRYRSARKTPEIFLITIVTVFLVTVWRRASKVGRVGHENREVGLPAARHAAFEEEEVEQPGQYGC